MGRKREGSVKSREDEYEKGGRYREVSQIHIRCAVPCQGLKGDSCCFPKQFVFYSLGDIGDYIFKSRVIIRISLSFMCINTCAHTHR